MESVSESSLPPSPRSERDPVEIQTLGQIVSDEVCDVIEDDEFFGDGLSRLVKDCMVEIGWNEKEVSRVQLAMILAERLRTKIAADSSLLLKAIEKCNFLVEELRVLNRDSEESSSAAAVAECKLHALLGNADVMRLDGYMDTVESWSKAPAEFGFVDMFTSVHLEEQLCVEGLSEGIDARHIAIFHELLRGVVEGRVNGEAARQIVDSLVGVAVQFPEDQSDLVFDLKFDLLNYLVEDTFMGSVTPVNAVLIDSLTPEEKVRVKKRAFEGQKDYHLRSLVMLSGKF